MQESFPHASLVAAVIVELAGMVAAKAEPKQVVEELYLSVFNRLPTETEQQQGEKYLTANGIADGAQDLMWALINSPAFLFNR